MKARFNGGLGAPAEARRFVLQELNRVLLPGSQPRRDDVVLVVSELVTNSVRAGADAVEVELRVSGDNVALKVVDDAEGWPTRRTSRADDQDGRGLAIVEALADGWKVTRRRRGKSVSVTWFRAREA